MNMRHSPNGSRILPSLTLLLAAVVLAADTFDPNYQPYGNQAPVALSKGAAGDLRKRLAARPGPERGVKAR